MKKLIVIVAIAAAFAALAAVHTGWKWGGGKVAITQASDTQSDSSPDGQPDGWTWDGDTPHPAG